MKKLIALLLIISTLAVSTLPVFAAGQELFVSEVTLVYEDSVEEAKKAIEGTDWILFEHDLNKEADFLINDGVYLAYKTTTDVEEAITDLRVMDMFGGFSSSNYEQELAQSREEYSAIVKQLQTPIAEFKALYEAGDAMASIAYRQMNYYRDGISEYGGESNMLMGDFLLNVPSEDHFVRILLEGNSGVVSNLIKLLAIGISGTQSTSLASRVAELYAVRDTLTDEKYHESAASLAAQLEQIEGKIHYYDDLAEDFDLNDENVTEEEFLFVYEYETLVGLLDKIMLGTTSLTDLLRGGEWTTKDLYPIVAALTPGQVELIALGQLETVLKFNAPTKPVSELEALLDEAEKQVLTDENGNLQVLDVYFGVDRSIFHGSFAMTTAAERQQALTGNEWSMDDAAAHSIIWLAMAGVMCIVEVFVYKAIAYYSTEFLPWAAQHLGTKAAGYAWGQSMLLNLSYAAIGIALLIAGLVSISLTVNYYNPAYTDIPNVMIDVRETDLGDKYVKYSAAKVFGNKNKNADFNAYEGKEWIALYYSKDAYAGNCLTPNFVIKQDNATVSRRHQGISMFGETDAFNLNSHVYNSDAPSTYLSVRYSTAKKAAADVGDVIGSMISAGSYALIAGAGMVVGMAIMSATITKKKGKNDQDGSAIPA